MSGATVFTTLDLTMGYYQMKLADIPKEITAFTSPQGFVSMEGAANGHENIRSSIPTSNGLDA